ncbi:MAG: hypothetical protein AB1473_09705 [Thermodesulfobacteriota bacterium]
MARDKAKMGKIKKTKKVEGRPSRAQGSPARPRVELQSSPFPRVKMSKVLIDFAAPYSRLAKDEEDWQALYSAAVVAWNAALLLERGMKREVDDMIERPPHHVPDEAKFIIKDLIRRKELLFADCKRFIYAHQVTMTRQGPHLFVTSSPD